MNVEKYTPWAILQKLIRFDTTNPPGNEKECINAIGSLLSSEGITYRLYAKDAKRPNLVATLRGEKKARPLLLYGHVDVVPAGPDGWKFPPFSGIEAHGCIWGRGALDMKGGIAMMLAALLQVKRSGLIPAGDIIFAALADEEAGGDMGARYLCSEHPYLFENVKYAIGEFGGNSFIISNKRFYPIQVTEKQVCWMKAEFRGPAGHGSMPVKGGAMAKLGRFLTRIDEKSLPVRLTGPAEKMIKAIARHLPAPASILLRGLCNPVLADPLLKIIGKAGENFSPLLRNTVSPTIVSGGSKINVIPDSVSLELDGRLVPGATPDTIIKELHQIAPDIDFNIEIFRFEPGPPESPDMGLFQFLADLIRKHDPHGVPVPMLLPGVTDSRHFAQLGIQTYGFIPMRLPEGFDFFTLVHSVNERVPKSALVFGARVLFDLIASYDRQ